MASAIIAWLACYSVLCLASCGGADPQGTAGTRPDTPASASDRFEERRRRMVEQQLRARDIKSERVLAAMRKVPRHRFVPAGQEDSAYEDHPLPIGRGQTISQPYIVAYMSEAAEIAPKEKVLEIGTGSGYQAAVLGELAAEVYTIEILPELAERARTTLADLGYTNVHVRAGNGYEGWAEHAPYDAIVVTAAPDEIPQALVDQLGVDGRMVIPVGAGNQDMIIITKTSEGIVQKRTIPVRFVPMTGKPRS